MGTPESPGPTSFMRGGATYLLFLTAADTDARSDLYRATGGTAGVWGVVEGSYSRLADEGDRLPEKVTLAEVRDALS